MENETEVDNIEEMLDDDEITSWEEGFMRGYDSEVKEVEEE